MDEAQIGLKLRVRQHAPIPLNAQIVCARGELLALVGPSGSGKTSLLRTIAGLLTPAEASVRCNGRVWLDTAAGVDLPAHARSVGYVFQSYALFPHMTALENVVAALGHLPSARRPERARELLARVHLTGLERRRPHELSGGQQQRVAVARALAREPAVLLLDEPFSAVDQVTRRKLQRELARLRADLNIPVLLVTHDLDEARLLADRITILHRGQTLQSAPPDEVMNRPRNTQVARLVELTNLFEGVVRVDTKRTFLLWAGRELEVDHNPGFADGERVSWVVPAAFVLLHQRVRPSHGERENPVSGVIEEYTPLGESTSLALRVDGDTRTVIEFAVPTHVARRNAIAVGQQASVTLLARGIHLMPWEGPQPPRD